MSTGRSSRPRVLFVGGDDVHRRLDLMLALGDEFALTGVGSDPGLAPTFRSHGFDYAYFPMKRGTTPISDLRATQSLTTLFRSLRPDVVHTFATKPSVWGRIAARRAGVPVVVGTLPGLGSLYSSKSPGSRVLRPVYERLQRWACRVSDATIFQNEHDRRQFVASGVCAEEEALVISSSGVRIDRFRRADVPADAVRRIRLDVGAEPEGVVVTMISRLIRSKGVLEFARAASIVRRETSRVKFLLVGPEDPRSLESLSSAELNEVRREVCWIGPRTDIPEILAASDIFALPSFYREGVPRVLLEAAAMGLPLIASPNPGSEEVVSDGVNGILVPPQDAEALSAAILRLARDPESRATMGESARRLAVEEFDVEGVARQTGSLYRRLLGIKSPMGTKAGGAHPVATVPHTTPGA